MSVAFLRGWPGLAIAALIGAAWLLCAAATAQGQNNAGRNDAARNSAAQNNVAQSDAENPALIPPVPLNERVLSIPGDPARPVALQVTVYTPAGPGPFPLAVLNHGATAISAQNRGTRYRYTFSAYYFLSRGYAVVMPMMRGFAGSGGRLVKNGCDVAATGRANAEDIRAVIDHFRTERDIDATRIVVAGQSFGGWNTLALGTLDVPGMRGLVSFSGGMKESDCIAPSTALAGAAADFGAHTRLPSLWFFGDNDTLFPPPTWREMYQRYADAGGRATLVDIGDFMDDSHQMLTHPESIPLWVPLLDRFLHSVGLPATPVEPRYLPTPIPPETHFAAVDDVARVPYLDDHGRAVYRTFLTRPLAPRVFVVSPNGSLAAAIGGFDPIARALAACGRNAAGCQVYAVDESVVWSPPAGAGAGPQSVRRTVPAGVTTVLAAATRLNPDCSSQDLPVLRITQPPRDGTAAVIRGMAHPNYPPGNQFAACNQQMVPATELNYTPKPGFTGTDSIIFEETRGDRSRVAFNVELTVR